MQPLKATHVKSSKQSRFRRPRTRRLVCNANRKSRGIHARPRGGGRRCGNLLTQNGRLDLCPQAKARCPAPELLPDRRAIASSGRAHWPFYRHGTGGAKLLPVSSHGAANPAGCRDQSVAGERTRPGARSHHACRPRRKCHGRRARHHASHRTNRRDGEHGRQPHLLPRCATVSGLPHTDSDAHSDGRLHGRAGRLFIFSPATWDRLPPLLDELS